MMVPENEDDAPVRHGPVDLPEDIGRLGPVDQVDRAWTRPY